MATDAQREGFAIALSDLLFPNKKHRDPKVVQFFYDWELAAKGGTARDPLNIKVGDYASTHDAAVATVHYLRASRFHTLTKDLRGGDTTGARGVLNKSHLLHVGLPSTQLPIPLDSGGALTPPKTHGSTGFSASKGGKAVENFFGSIGSDIGSAGGGIFHGLTSGVTLVIVVLVLVLVLKK